MNPNLADIFVPYRINDSLFGGRVFADKKYIAPKLLLFNILRYFRTELHRLSRPVSLLFRIEG
jgi:hypothetical protein